MNTHYPGSTFYPTAAKGGYGVPDGQMRPIAAVWHTVEGFSSTLRAWAQERPPVHRVSYHVVLPLAGGVDQFVEFSTPAWHAGRRDYRDGSLVRPAWPLYRDNENVGAYTIGISAEGFTAASAWNAAQVNEAVKLTRWLAQQGITEHVTHQTLNPLTRTDPGPRWPEAAIREAAKEVDMGGNAWIVQPGDGLWAISREVGVSVADLVQWNGITDPSLIFVGQVLRLDPSLRPAAAATRDDIEALRRIEAGGTATAAEAAGLRSRLEAV